MSPPENFLSVLQQVLGGVLEGAGYKLEGSPMQQARGLFRFGKMLAESRSAFIEFQMLYHSDVSRFRLNLIRDTQDGREEFTLAYVMRHFYNSQALEDDEHWWVYRQDLAQQLYEAGRLLFGYGVPWLEGQTLKE